MLLVEQSYKEQVECMLKDFFIDWAMSDELPRKVDAIDNFIKEWVEVNCS